MAEQTKQTTVLNRQTSLDIPWMRLWEKKPERAYSALQEDPKAMMIHIDYLTMLEELEFR